MTPRMTTEQIKQRRRRIQQGGDRFDDDELELAWRVGLICLAILALGFFMLLK